MSNKGNTKPVYRMRIMTLALITLLCVSVPLTARFLTDDASSLPSDQNVPQVNVDTGSLHVLDTSLPPDSARGLSVTMLAGEKNSVQITWDALPDVKDQFIVLRANYIQNTPDIALGSTPIKVVDADKIKVVLDRNLMPGRYYYCVIPKSKFDARNIQLFPGENFSTNPIVIQSESATGDSRTVAMLKAVTIDDRSVLLSWETIANFTGEYVLFRSRAPIDTADKLNLSEIIARVPATTTRYLDTSAPSGRHFYAVACKTLDGILYSDLARGLNYTTDSIFLGGTIGVRGIRALRSGNTVTITWRMSADTSSRPFYLLRTETKPTGRETLAGSVLIDTVQSSAEKYVELNVLPGRYYYVLAPANFRDDDDFSLLAGVNVTDPPVTIPAKKVIKKNTSAEADIQTPKKETTSENPRDPLFDALVPITDIKKQVSDNDILSSLETVKPIETIKPAPLKDEFGFDIEETTSTHKKVTEPEINGMQTDHNKMSNAIPKKQTTPPLDTIEVPDTISDNSENKTPAIAKQPDETEPVEETQQKQIKPNEIKKTTPPVKKKEPATQNRNALKGIDSIINGSFAQGEYARAIKELKSLLRSNAANDDAAKAKLYLARSYIELGKYRDALPYLNGADVKRLYPRESNFWREYSIDRMR